MDYTGSGGSSGDEGFDPSQVQARARGKRRVEPEEGSLRQMIAQFPGNCKGCGKEIKVGHSILWGKNRGAWHDRDECRPQIATKTDPAAARKPRRGPVDGKDLDQKRQDNEYDVPVVIRVRAPSWKDAQDEVRILLRQTFERHPVPMAFKFLGKKKK